MLNLIKIVLAHVKIKLDHVKIKLDHAREPPSPHTFPLMCFKNTHRSRFCAKAVCGCIVCLPFKPQTQQRFKITLDHVKIMLEQKNMLESC